MADIDKPYRTWYTNFPVDSTLPPLDFTLNAQSIAARPARHLGPGIRAPSNLGQTLITGYVYVYYKPERYTPCPYQPFTSAARVSTTTSDPYLVKEVPCNGLEVQHEDDRLDKDRGRDNLRGRPTHPAHVDAAEGMPAKDRAGEAVRGEHGQQGLHSLDGGREGG